MSVLTAPVMCFCRVYCRNTSLTISRLTKSLVFFKTLVNNSKRNCIHQCLDHTPTLYLWRRMPVPDGSDDHFRKAISSRLNHCACPGCGKLIAAPPSDCRPCQGKITLVRLDLPPYGTFLRYLEGDWCICYSSSNQNCLDRNSLATQSHIRK